MGLRAAFILALILILVIQPVPSSSSSPEPKQIRLYVSPPRLPADNRTYEAVFIQLLGSTGLPARAPRDIEVALSSSDASVIRVEGRVIVKAGETYAIAKVSTTYTAGSATITAAATGLGSASATASTVSLMPTRVVAYALPSTLPADGRRHMALIIQLQDSSGNPVKAPAGGLNVSLYSSNNSICAVDPYVVINEGESYAVASLIPGATGSATITPMASGIASSGVTVRVQEPSNQKPAKIKFYTLPSKLPADGRHHRIIAIQLLDAQGRIVRAEFDVKITLSSSNIEVGAVNETVVIGAGETYVIAEFKATFRQGTTKIIAVAPDLQMDQATITTFSLLPAKIVSYCALPSIPADGRRHRVLVLQLQDQRGLPAADSRGIEVTLTSSNEHVASVNRTVFIPAKASCVLVDVRSGCIAGSAYITAQATGLSSSQVQVATKLIDSFSLKVKVLAYPERPRPGETVHVKIYVTIEDLSPALGATVKVSSDVKVGFAKVVEEGGGYYATSFRAPNATSPITIKVTAEASLTGYVSGSGRAEIKVEPYVRLGGVKITVVGEDGKPIKNVRVTSVSGPPAAPPLSSMTDENGVVQFIGIPEGQYLFEVSGEGYVEQRVAVTVKADQTASISLTLAAAEQPTWIWIKAAAIALAAAAAATATFKLRRKISLKKRCEVKSEEKMQEDNAKQSIKHQTPS